MFTLSPCRTATCLIWICTATSFAADWPQWRGPNGDGISTEAGWSAEAPAIQWTQNVGRGYAGVNVVGERLYTGGHVNGQDVIWCLNTRDGKTRWTHRYNAALMNNLHEGGPAASPTIHDGKVYTLSKEGHIFCLDATDGKVIWQADFKETSGLRRPPEWGFSASAVIVGPHAIFSAGPTIAYDKNTGRVAWKSKSHTPGYATPALFDIDGKPTLAAFNSYGLVLVDAASGRDLSEFRWNTSYHVNSATPIPVDGGKAFYISSGYNKGSALVKRDGRHLEALWQNRSMRNHMNTCVMLGDHAYGFDGNTGRGEVHLVCQSIKTGEVAWEQAGLGCGGLIAADGKLIIQTEGGELVIAEASPQAFKPLSRTRVFNGTSWTAPTMAHGHIYTRSAAGDLTCVRVTKP